MIKSKNVEVLCDFVNYCIDNPDLRFWQALTSWSGHSSILLADFDWDGKCSEADPCVRTVDPFYWEGKDA